MCGIAGWVDWERDLSAERATAQAMVDTMVRRGPDAGGLWLSPRAALGNRRLVVIDAEGGRQPMVADDAAGEVVLTYNGELYNFRELRRELQARGHRFRTRSDTEVVLRAYLEWGESAVGRFDGMYAFAIWDAGRERLLLGRDRLGVKPLYYAPLRAGILFGSEPKAILANPLFRPCVDAEGLAEIFALPAAKTPGHAFLRGLHEVRPAHGLSFTRAGLRARRYWQLAAVEHRDDEATTAARVRELLSGAVGRQLVADVPLCALLSGGLDSSALTALAARELALDGRRVATFAVDFPSSEEHFAADAWRPALDGPYVRTVAAAVNARHADVVLETADLLSAAREALEARDLPGLALLDVPLLLLCRGARRGATVALSGESADEVFGGYPWFADAEALAAPTFPWMAGVPSPAMILAAEAQARLRVEEYTGDRYREALAEVPRLGAEGDRERRIREAFYLGITRFLPLLLDRNDRMSMAVGLEVRVPYCDHALVEYAWNVPWATKNAGGQEKGVLRRAVADLLPREIVERPKSAFPVPRDPAYAAATRQQARALIADHGSPLHALLDPTLLTMAVDWPEEAPHAAQVVWLLCYVLGVDAWLRRYRVSLV
jgi:asparagine synthase (glutamine-hydrolysing)